MLYNLNALVGDLVMNKIMIFNLSALVLFVA